MRFALLIAALIGAFFVGKCSTSKPPEEIVHEVEVAPCPEQGEKEDEQYIGDGEIRFDDQCQDVRLDTQCRESFLFLPERRGDTKIYGEPDDQDFPVPSFVVLKPVQKKQRIVLALRKKVLLKPVGKKKRIAPPGKKVEEYVPRIFDDNTQYACKGNLIPAVLATITDLEARSILYGVGPLSDCSGILHRVLMGVQKRCPEHKYPSLALCRDSRELARWYHEQGELVLIKDAVAQSDLIRPGMVLFFGRTGVRYKNPSSKTLFSSRYGIHHVGVVVRVYKDTRGTVTRYELFHGHGRRGRTKASVTKWHKRRPTRASYPPLGNGRQQLVAAAQIVGPVKAKQQAIEKLEGKVHIQNR
ncbi:MAG: hypothetical protein D3916_10870 [Candidatus Electrothrix sp. MAN1_4]|nr:hypothetical protein [Candidatus Electrothrix sp. MAN1_4]